MTQIDIYDLLTPDDLTAVNFRTMTVDEIAQTLGARLGLEFKFNGFLTSIRQNRAKALFCRSRCRTTQ